MPRYNQKQKIEYAKKDLQLKLNHEGRLSIAIKRPLLALYKLVCCQDYQQYPNVKNNPKWNVIRTQIVNTLKNHYAQVGKSFARFQTKDMGLEYKDILNNGSEVDKRTLELFERMAERQADIIMENTVDADKRNRDAVVASVLTRYVRDYVDEINLRTISYEDAAVLIAFLKKLTNRANLIGLVETRNSAEIAKLITTLRVRQAMIEREAGELTAADFESRVRSDIHEGTSLQALVGAYLGAEVIGFNAKKEWNAILDDRTREAHRLADGQVVNIEEDFIVDDEPLMYPGDDSRASIGNTINCRCTAMYYYD